MSGTSVDDQLVLEPVTGPPLETRTITGEEPVLIGRGQDCNMCLADPSVSRGHATVVRRGGKWFITDLGSRHGTVLNGIELEPDKPALLAAGDFLRIGPYTLRLNLGATPSRTIAITDGVKDAGTLVERVPARELDSLLARRLELLIDGAVAIQNAPTEEKLAAALLELVLAGSGYQRAAVLRHQGSKDEVEVIDARDLGAPGRPDFTFSLSLIKEAAKGHVARLAEDAPVELGMSISRLAIHSALCAPILLDNLVIGSIYLDSRGSERAGAPDSSGFCQAVARLAGLALASLRHKDLAKRQERLETDLQAARKAQDFLTPPERGNVGHVKYAMRTHPGRIVAGDLFDIFEMDETHVGVCCGDVCGQGVGAAMLMTTILSHVRAAMLHADNPAVVVAEVNRYLVPRSPDNMFASLWVGVFDRVTGKLTYVDAGHGHWLRKPAGGAPGPVPGDGNLLVGIDADAPFVASSVDLAAGDRVIVYSDGVVEHRSPEGEEFGTARLQEVLAGSATPEQDVEAAFAALRTFIGNHGLEDDVTLASIEIVDGA